MWETNWQCLVLIALLGTQTARAAETNEQSCFANPNADDDDSQQHSCFNADLLLQARGSRRPLRPADLPPPQLYTNWSHNSTVTTAQSTRNWTVAKGYIPQVGRSSTERSSSSSKNNSLVSEWDLLVGVVSRNEVSRMLQFLRDVPLDNDPDTVDGYSTQEIFVDNPSLRQGLSGKPDLESPQQAHERQSIRKELLAITQPILDERITPYVNQRYPQACQGQCQPCFSLIRRYLHNERQSHAPHHDAHALVTVVVSLSDHGIEYNGGLYVMAAAGNHGQPYFMGLHRGDAAVHQSDLWHGVRVWPTKNGRATRWSWILWFRDSDCHEDNDHSHEWFVDCAVGGNPTCQYLYATTHAPGRSVQEQEQHVLEWNQRAAEQGHSAASIKLARAYAKKLPSSLSYDRSQARKWYGRAIDSSNDPDAHYGLASMLLEDLAEGGEYSLSEIAILGQVVAHLEASAQGGHPFASFNLGIVHLFGYYYRQDATLAAEWFEHSGLPEGLAARAMYYSSLPGEDNSKRALEYKRRAVSLGYGMPWRVVARERTGYGGAAGIDLNLKWPPNEQQQVPPKW